MLRLNIERLVRLRGVKHTRAYLINHGFTAGEARSLLNPEMRSIRLSTIVRLCNIFQCTPDMLFEWTGKTKNHLEPLMRGNAMEITELLEGKSVGEIERILKGLGKQGD